MIRDIKMKKEINITVVGDFKRYCQIKIKDKELNIKRIPLHINEKHTSHQNGISSIQFMDGTEHAHLIIDVNVDKTKSFRFGLLCYSFMQEPCYRFDSDGVTHINPPEDGVTLKQRQISTPHFHKYNEKGQNIAYKTDLLIRDETALLCDYNKALRHFCHEENIEISSETVIKPETLALGTSDFPDPLEGVEFK